MGFVFVSPEFVDGVSRKTAEGQGVWRQVRQGLREKAEEAMLKGPWSVTYFGAAAPSGDPHDYYSEAPYWWPNPDDPEGPYIRKDGITRHDRFMGHRQSIDDLAETALVLCLAGYYLHEKRYLARAAELLRIWFIDPDTRMNPHIEYGEAIRGICDGRAAGVIVLRQVDKIVHALGFLEQHPDWPEIIAGMRGWLSQMLERLTTSKIGRRKAGPQAITRCGGRLMSRPLPLIPVIWRSCTWRSTITARRSFRSRSSRTAACRRSWREPARFTIRCSIWTQPPCCAKLHAVRGAICGDSGQRTGGAWREPFGSCCRT
nr:alginate lyase family protein [Paenibacillus hamazuiensis]